MLRRQFGSIAALLTLLIAAWAGGCTATGSSDPKPTVEADGEEDGSDRTNRRDGSETGLSTSDSGLASDGEESSTSDSDGSAPEDVEESTDVEDRSDTDRFAGDAAADGDTESNETDGTVDDANDNGDTEDAEDSAGAVCGDGVVEGGESCDDGSISSNCDTYHDGGDGTCVPPGECSDDYVLESGTCVDEQIDEHVHIYVTNTCQLSVQPKRVTVPRGRTVSFVYHNHSSSYSVDVWLSYIGGYTDLQQGATWDDSFVHCRNGSRPYDAYADITINGLSLDDSHCPGHRMMIECK